MIKLMSKFFPVCSDLIEHKYSFNLQENDNKLIKLCESRMSYKCDESYIYMIINGRKIKKKISDLAIHFIDFKNPAKHPPEVCHAVLRTALLVEKLRKAGYLCFFHGVSSNAAVTHELLTAFRFYNTNLAFNMLGVKKLRLFEDKINNIEEIIESRDKHPDKFDDNNYSKYILSCSGDINHQERCESAMWFFLNNTNMKDVIYKSDIIGKIKNENFKLLVTDMIGSLEKLGIRKYGGQIYVIAIQENQINKEELRHRYVYRSHQLGVKCNCLFDTKLCDDDRFMYVLKNNNIGKTDESNIYCTDEYMDKYMPQYRIFAQTLDEDESSKVFSVHSMNEKKREEWINLINPIKYVIKTYVRLEKICESTTSEELESILLRLDLNCNIIHSEYLYENFIKGVREMILDKNQHIMRHREYLYENLPKDILNFITEIIPEFDKKNTPKTDC